IASAMLYAFDHRGMVELIRQNDASRQEARKRRERGFVRHIAGIEQECGFLAMQVGKFGFEQYMKVAGAGNVAGAAGTGADLIKRLMHGRENERMLAHAQIVIRAPDGDFSLTFGATMKRTRETPADPAEVGEFAISALAAHLIQGGIEGTGIVECF